MGIQDDEPITPPARLQALTSWQISKIATVASRLTAQRMPLTARSDFAVLAALEEFGPLSQADLGRRLGLDRNDVNAIMTRLDQRRLVTRRVDPSNRRRNIVRVTAVGRRQLDQIQEHADAAQTDLLAGLTDSEARQLHRLLAKALAAHHTQPA